MLNFTSDLTNAFKKDSTRAYWLLRLYYGDESNFIGFGSKPVVVGSDVYWEALSLGRFGQSTGLDDFIVSNGTVSVTLPNTPKAVEGGRFSDMFVSKKFTNRKWELFQASDGVAFSTNNMIASGIIGADFDNTDTEITVYLNDWWVRYNIELPTNRVTKELYPNAPEKNLDSPIPMGYGDCSTNTVEDGFTAHLVKGRFPAIIVDKWNETAFNVQAKPDNEAMHTLNANNLYIHNKQYMACDSANVTITAATPIMTFKGVKWTAYIPLEKHVTYDDTNYDNTYDRDVATSYNLDATGAAKVTTGWYVKNSEVIGKIETAAPDSHTVKLWVLTDSKTGTAPVKGGPANGWYFQHRTGPTTYDLNWALDSQGVDVTGKYSSTQLENWVFAEFASGSDTYYLMEIDDAFSANWNQIVPIIEVGYIIELTTSQSFEKEIRVDDKPFITGNRQGGYRITERHHIEPLYITDVGEYVYWAGKGRKYGAWIDADSRTNGYNQGDLIENPVYIIEDILRTELGLTSSEIDYASFDVAGNTTNGTIGEVFNDSVVDIKFAFSQPKKIFAKTLIRKICKLSGLYFFWSSGKAKVVARKRTYAAVVDTVDFRYIAYPSPENSGVQKPKTSMTSFNEIVNYFTIKYNFDYGANKTIKSRTPDDNASLLDDTSRDAYSFDSTYLKSDIKFDLTLDETTADNLGEALISYFKDRKPIIEIETTSPRWNHLENTDIINIDNFPSSFTLFGTEISLTNTFMIIKKSAVTNGSRFTLVKLPGSV